MIGSFSRTRNDANDPRRARCTVCHCMPSATSVSGGRASKSARASSRLACMLEETSNFELVAAMTSAHGSPSGATAECCLSHKRRSETLRQPRTDMLSTPKWVRMAYSRTLSRTRGSLVSMADANSAADALGPPLTALAAAKRRGSTSAQCVRQKAASVGSARRSSSKRSTSKSASSRSSAAAKRAPGDSTYARSSSRLCSARSTASPLAGIASASSSAEAGGANWPIPSSASVSSTRLSVFVAHLLAPNSVSMSPRRRIRMRSVFGPTVKRCTVLIRSSLASIRR